MQPVFLMFMLKHKVLIPVQCLVLQLWLLDDYSILVKVTFLELISGIVYLLNVAGLE